MVSALKEKRKARKLSLEDLGDILEVNKSTVSRWEKRGIPVDRVDAVSKALGIAPQMLRPDVHKVFVKNGRAA